MTSSGGHASCARMRAAAAVSIRQATTLESLPDENAQTRGFPACITRSIVRMATAALGHSSIDEPLCMACGEAGTKEEGTAEEEDNNMVKGACNAVVSSVRYKSNIWRVWTQFSAPEHLEESVSNEDAKSMSTPVPMQPPPSPINMVGREVGAARWPQPLTLSRPPWKGVVLACNDLRVWAETIAFPRPVALLRQDEVDQHVARCHADGLLDHSVPVLW